MRMKKIKNCDCTLIMTGILLVLLCLTAPSSLCASLQAQSTPQPLPEVRALLDKGKKAEKQSKAAEALRLYEEASQVAQEHKDLAGRAEALAAQGNLLLFDQPAKSQALTEQALPLYQELKDEFGQAECLFTLGNAAALLKKPELALTRYDAAYQIYKKTAKKPGQALTLLMIGNVYRDAGKSPENSSLLRRGAGSLSGNRGQAAPGDGVG